MGISSGVGNVNTMPVGMVVPFAGSNAPANWLLCAGQAVSRTQYAGLYLVIGTTHGVGDGSTTFNLPDLRGRTIAGLDNMGGSAANRITNAVSGIAATTLGAAGGSQLFHQHQHANTATFSGTAGTTGNDSPDHSHSGTLPSNSWNGAGTVTVFTTPQANIYNFPFSTGGASARHGHPFTPAGTVSVSNVDAGTGASQNMPPTIILNYIIRI